MDVVLGLRRPWQYDEEQTEYYVIKEDKGTLKEAELQRETEETEVDASLQHKLILVDAYVHARMYSLKYRSAHVYKMHDIVLYLLARAPACIGQDLERAARAAWAPEGRSRRGEDQARCCGRQGLGAEYDYIISMHKKAIPLLALASLLWSSKATSSAWPGRSPSSRKWLTPWGNGMISRGLNSPRIYMQSSETNAP